MQGTLRVVKISVQVQQSSFSSFSHVHTYLDWSDLPNRWIYVVWWLSNCIQCDAHIVIKNTSTFHLHGTVCNIIWAEHCGVSNVLIFSQRWVFGLWSSWLWCMWCCVLVAVCAAFLLGQPWDWEWYVPMEYWCSHMELQPRKTTVWTTSLTFYVILTF